MIYTLRAIAFIVCIVLIIVIMWKLFKTIKEINIIEEEVKMNLYDEENNCFVPNLPEMRYWEIITKISSHKNISVKEAVRKYHELSGIPSNDILDVLLNTNEKDLIPFYSEVEICNNTEKLLSYGIQSNCAGLRTYIIDIVIDDEDNTGNRIYYLVSADSSLYSCEILQRID